MALPDACAVAIVDDSGLSASARLATALDRAEFWTTLRSVRAESPRILIKPELAGFAVGSPTVTDPALVESLIDVLHDHGFTNVAVAGAADSSALWAENRELYALSDLLGYRYETPRGHPYDIIDLAEQQVDGVFATDSALRGCAIAREWLEADVRIVFSKNRTDVSMGYALCLDTLIGALPLIDKDLHYRKRRHPGDVVAALLAVAPVQFCLIDATTSAHGPGARRSPVAIDTGTIIAASDIVLADYAGALKMGLDPKVSPLFERVLRTQPLPRRYIVSGSLDVYPRWQNVQPLSVQAAKLRGQTETFDRLIEPWLQRVDPALFPLKHPLDARVNAMLADHFADTGARQWVLTAVNALLAWFDTIVTAYRTLFDKDALQQQAAPLGFDARTVPDVAFANLVAELRDLEPLAATAPQVSEELRWRYLDQAVLFRYARVLPIDFVSFVRRVDIARTIEFMNDYLGGVLVVLADDEEGRPVRQAERNIYLPQPNYLVLFQGKPIDVSKLEVVEYDTDRHRLYWKTILSENGSAEYDDGIATFKRVEGGTRVSIIGRQQFALPAFFQVFDPDLIPGLKAKLVTHAYQTFFDRTAANFEALVEGREIRIGRPVDEPSPRLIEQLMPLLEQLAELAAPLLRRLSSDAAGSEPDHSLDSDGFIHVVPSQSESAPLDPNRWLAEWSRFADGLGQAIRRDLGA